MMDTETRVLSAQVFGVDSADDYGAFVLDHDCSGGFGVE